MPIEKTHAINQDGSLTVTHDEGFNPDGSAAVSRWHVPADQLARHAPMFEGEMRAGDRSAFLDAIAEARKARER